MNKLPIDPSNVIPLVGALPLNGKIPATATGTLTVDLGAVASNYTFYQSVAPKSRIAAVVKGDAYGLGMIPVARKLASIGCDTFFVAYPEEGMRLRMVLPQAIIYVLGGLMIGAEQYYHEHHLIPMIADLDQLHAWRKFAGSVGETLSCGLHFDTGITRTGLLPYEVDVLHQNPAYLQGLTLTMLMSHLACADEPHHPMNEEQRLEFERMTIYWPDVPRSLTNSSGAFLGPAFHYDVLRTGIGLYGSITTDASFEGHALRHVVTVKAKILQIKEAHAGRTVGYGGTYHVKNAARVATLAVGYADGYLRSLSNRGFVSLGKYKAPVIGRVSMDLLTIDVSEIPETFAHVGSWVELVGESLTVDQLAVMAGTRPWEILTRLGTRYHRLYSE